MTISAKALIQARFAQSAANTEYTAPSGGHTIIDKFTATNTDSGSHQITVYLVPTGGTAQSSNTVVSALSISAGATTDLTQLQNHILNSTDFIAVLADAPSVVVIRASGREIT